MELFLFRVSVVEIYIKIELFYLIFDEYKF